MHVLSGLCGPFYLETREKREGDRKKREKEREKERERKREREREKKTSPPPLLSSPLLPHPIDREKIHNLPKKKLL